MDYYSPFCGPDAISIVVEAQGALMCRSSTLAVLADSGPFRGLLLTVLGSHSYFHDDSGVRLHVRRQHSQFWQILARFVDYYSPFWGPIAISTIDDSRGAFTCPSSTLTILVDFGPFRGLLLTLLGSRTDFHD